MKSVVVGRSHTLVLMTDGSVQGTGRQNMFGDNSKDAGNKLTFTKILSGVKTVAAGNLSLTLTLTLTVTLTKLNP